MTGALRLRLVLTSALFVAALLQSAVSARVHFLGGQANWLLTTALVGSLFCSVNGGAVLGLIAGITEASLASPPHGGFGSIAVSWTIVCLVVGWLEEALFRDNVTLAAATSAAGTLLAGGLFFIGSPQPHPGHWAQMLAGSAVLDTIISVPVYLLIVRLVRHSWPGIQT